MLIDELRTRVISMSEIAYWRFVQIYNRFISICKYVSLTLFKVKGSCVQFALTVKY